MREVVYKLDSGNKMGGKSLDGGFVVDLSTIRTKKVDAIDLRI